jgi:thiol:disulfide interchange protein DsbD
LSRLRLATVMIVFAITLSCTKPPVQNNVPGTSGSQSTQPRNSVDVVKASAQEVAINPGADGDAVVLLNIEKGYHVNANPPTFPFLRATQLEINKSPGVSVIAIVYPDAITKSFPFAEKPLAIYEGLTNIKVKLKVDKSVQPSTQNLPAKLQVQACDDQVCYAPGTLDVSIPLRVK